MYVDGSQPGKKLYFLAWYILLLLACLLDHSNPDLLHGRDTQIRRCDEEKQVKIKMCLVT